MREILFRGKRTDTGEWVEGLLITVELDTYSEVEKAKYTHCIVEPKVEMYRGEIGNFEFVKPDTVGQFTGLTDRNGKRIFEGDIVSFTRTNALGYTNARIGEVKYYTELPIYYILATTGDGWDWCDCDNIEVIGNIHDNPELLER